MNVREAAYANLEVSAESGHELTFLCPVHDDSTPSASLNVVKKLWICYACGAGGKVEDLLDGNFDEVTPEELDLIVSELDKQPPRVLPESWLAQFDFAYEVANYWIKTRGLTAPTVDRFGLGFDPGQNAGVVPIRNPRGELLGVFRRFVKPFNRRYEYPKHFPMSEYLYGYHEASQDNLSGPVALTEGAIDAMALWDVGVPALALYGSRVSDKQIELLNRLDAPYYVMCFDMDHAGIMARMALGKAGLRPLVFDARWDESEGKDVAELSPDRRLQVVQDAGIMTY